MQNLSFIKTSGAQKFIVQKEELQLSGLPKQFVDKRNVSFISPDVDMMSANDTTLTNTTTQLPYRKQVHLLVYKCPDDSQCVQHQAIHVLLLPSRLMRTPSSAWRSDRVPRATTPSLSSIHNYWTMVEPSSLPSSCPWWSMLMILQVTILTTYTAVTHGSCTGDHRSKGLPDCRNWIWKGKVE